MISQLTHLIPMNTRLILLAFAISVPSCDRSAQRQQEAIAFVKSIGGVVRLDDKSQTDPKPIRHVSFVGSRENLAKLDDSAMSRVADLGQIEEFHINGYPAFTDQGIASLAKVQGLERIMLWGAHKLTDQCFEHLSQMKSLTSLNAAYSGIETMTGANLGSLAALPNLRSLNLSNLYKLEGQNLAHLSALKQLETLDLMHNPKVADADLAFMSALTHLKQLYLGSTPLTDACIPHLARLQALEALNLSNSKITDTGIRGLKGLKQLKKLNLKQTSVTDGGVAELQAALPGLTITR